MLIWPLSRVLVQNVRSAYQSLSYKSFFPFRSIPDSFYAGRNVTKENPSFEAKNEFSQLDYSSTHVLLTDSIYSIGKVLSCTKSGRAGAVIKALVFASTRLSMPFNIEHWVVRAAPAFTWVKDTKYMKEVTREQLFKWKKAELYLFCSSLHSWTESVWKELSFSLVLQPPLSWREHS